MSRSLLYSGVILACVFWVCLSGAASSAEMVETAHLLVSDKEGQFTAEQLDRFAAKAEEGIRNSIQFWEIEDKFSGTGRVGLELYKERSGRSFTVFFLHGSGPKQQRIVRVYGVQSPEEMVHKLTHALFPTDDKLVRNMMGVPTERRFGNPLSFPMCGRNLDAWAVALRLTGSSIPLKNLDQTHESWGMAFKDEMPVVSDRTRQHASYVAAGSFGDFLIRTYGVEKIKAFFRASLQNERPWQKVFGKDLSELEAQWIRDLDAYGPAHGDEVDPLVSLWRRDSKTACYETQGTMDKIKVPEKKQKRRGTLF